MRPIDPQTYINSPDHPHGLQELISDPDFTRKVDDYPTRLGIVAADSVLQLINTYGVDRRQAPRFIERTVAHFLGATAITLTEKEIGIIRAQIKKLTGF